MDQRAFSPFFQSDSAHTALPKGLGGHMKLSARNILPGTTAHVRIAVGGAVITASITNEAVDELKLAQGQSAHAVIKASDVMIAVDV